MKTSILPLYLFANDGCGVENFGFREGIFPRRNATNPIAHYRRVPYS